MDFESHPSLKHWSAKKYDIVVQPVGLFCNLWTSDVCTVNNQYLSSATSVFIITNYITAVSELLDILFVLLPYLYEYWIPLVGSHRQLLFSGTDHRCYCLMFISEMDKVSYQLLLQCNLVNNKF